MPKIRLIAQKKDAQNTQNNGQKGMFFLTFNRIFAIKEKGSFYGITQTNKGTQTNTNVYNHTHTHTLNT